MKDNLPTRFDQTLNQFRADRIRIAGKFELSVVSTGVSCRKGCHKCCYYPVLTSIMEALVVYRGVVKKRLWTSSLKARFQEASDRVKGLNLEVWVLSQIPCPLLDQKSGTCLAYESRPFFCRTTFSKADPHYCDPSHSQGQPPVVDRKEALLEMINTEEMLLRKHRLGRIVLPMSSAVLLAERLDKGEIDFSTVGLLVWKDYIQQW